MDEAAVLTWRAPEWLWALFGLPLVALFLFLRERARGRLANRFASESLRGTSNRLRPLRPLALTLAVAAAVIALAGPRYGQESVEVTERGHNRVIVLDVSSSMSAEDVGTSRLVAAKAIAREIIAAHSGRVGLVIFEGEPQVIAPLTHDVDAVITLLGSVEAGETEEAGSNLEAALGEARKLLAGRAGEGAEVIVFSDGEEQGGDVEKALPLLRSAGIVVSTVVVGTPEGARIPLRQGRGYLRDESGQEVVTRAATGRMAAAAKATGGRAYVNPFGAQLVRQLSASGIATTGSAQTMTIPVERFQWPLGAALALFFLGSLTHRGAE